MHGERNKRVVQGQANSVHTCYNFGLSPCLSTVCHQTLNCVTEAHNLKYTHDTLCRLTSLLAIICAIHIQMWVQTCTMDFFDNLHAPLSVTVSLEEVVILSYTSQLIFRLTIVESFSNYPRSELLNKEIKIVTSFLVQCLVDGLCSRNLMLVATPSSTMTERIIAGWGVIQAFTL